MDFDDVLAEIGEFGRYQLTNYFLLCLPVFFGAANSLSYVFTAGIPNYRCEIPECDDPKDLVYNQSWMQNAVPGKHLTGTFIPEHCEKFKFVNTTIYENSSQICPAKWFSKEQEHCNSWVFDPTERTIVSDWKITCIENQWKLALVGTAHFLGIVIGSGVFGAFADRFGRKLIFIVGTMFMSITGIAQALSQNYTTFIIFAFLNAVGTSGVYPLAFIIGVEMVGRTKREASGIILDYFYALGEAIVGVIMWISKDWVVLQYIVSVPPLLFIFYYWIIPESIRWLLAKKHYVEARIIIKKAAKVNGAVLSKEALAIFEEKPSDIMSGPINGKVHDICEKEKAKHQSFLTWKELLHSKIMLGRMAILFYIWATNAFVFYGLSLNSTNLSGNKYLNYILVCLVEIPGYTMAWICMNKLGRRWSLSGSFLVCSVTCIAGAIVTEDYTWILIILFLMGKLAITSSFGVIYVHTSEMLPTIIRSGGVGSMSTSARIGALVAPFVALLGNYVKFLPLLLFGMVALVGALLALLLPETLGKRLPDTVEEAERLDKRPRRHIVVDTS